MPRPAIVLMHGSGGNVSFWFTRLQPYLAAAGVALFAPNYFERTGTVRASLADITDGVHVPLWIDTLRAAMLHVAAQPGIDPSRIAMVGISLGSFLSLAYAAEISAGGPQGHEWLRPNCIVELSGGLVEPYASRATSRLPPTLILHGEQDSIVPVSQAHDLDRRLIALGVAHQVHILPGEGHWFSPAAQGKLLLVVGTFLAQQLAEQSRPNP